MGELTEDFDHFIELNEQFLNKFWEWFDALNDKQKKKFCEDPRDIAHRYYYTKVFMPQTKSQRNVV